MMAAKAMRTKARGEARLAAELLGALVGDVVPDELLLVEVLLVVPMRG